MTIAIRIRRTILMDVQKSLISGKKDEDEKEKDDCYCKNKSNDNFYEIAKS